MSDHRNLSFGVRAVASSPWLRMVSGLTFPVSFNFNKAMKKSRAKEESRCMLKKMLPHWQLYMLEDVGSLRKQWIDLGDRKKSLETGTRNSKPHKCQSNSINVIPGIPHNVPSTLLLERAIPRGNPPKTLPLCSNMFSFAGNKH